MYKRKEVGFLVLILFLSFRAVAQKPLVQITVTNLSLKAKMPSSIKNWINVAKGIGLTAQKSSPENKSEARLILQIKQSSNKICGNLWEDAKGVSFSGIKNFSSVELSACLINCDVLEAGNYTLCAQFFNTDHYPISVEFCREFTVL